MHRTLTHLAFQADRLHESWLFWGLLTVATVALYARMVATWLS